MGWWGCGVVDGDGPWDIISTIESESGVSALGQDKNGNDLRVDKMPMDVRQQLFRKQREAFSKMAISTMLDVCKGMEEDDLIIMTIGFLFLKWEVTLPDEFKQQVLDAIDRDDSSCWNDQEDRIRQMIKFKECIEKQDGEGLEHCGLFWEGVFTARTHFD